MLRNYRKPLILAAPKIGLKHPSALSRIEDFAEQASFNPVISHNFACKKATDKQHVIFCSGKIGFDLQQIVAETADGLSANVQVIKVEELAPFPSDTIAKTLTSSSGGKALSYTWIQEEPVNQGAFTFAKLHIDRVLRDLNETTELQFIGRPSMHSFCSGAAVDHKAQSDKIREQIQQLLTS